MSTPDPFLEFMETIAAAGRTLRHLAGAGQAGFDCDGKTMEILNRWGRAPRPTETLEAIREDLGDCRRCRLCKERNHIVFGTGDPRAGLVFVGEGPGFEEDRQGEPFVGAAGKLLTKIIHVMDLTRERVYICNIVKCRPPGNRNPLPDEIEKCFPFLKRQLSSIRPKVVCALGSVAANALLGVDTPISRLRGRFHDFKGIPVMPTYHPAYLLRNPARKRDVWEDMKKIMALIAESEDAT